MTATDRAAEFSATMRFAAVPEACRRLAILHLFDTLGVALAGSLEEQSEIVAQTVAPDGSAGPASILGTARTCSPQAAALANGTAAHALDFDDVQHPAYAHPTTVLFPAIFALAEARGASGAQLVSAYAVGLTVAHALGCAMNTEHYARGWHATSTIGSVAAAAACANLLGLNVERTRNAIGVGATQACGFKQNFGTMAKPLHAGIAAQNGVFAALLAERGFTASEISLDGPAGFGAVFGPRFDAGAMNEALASGMPDAFEGLALKRYPSCAATHAILDIVTGLIATGEIAGASDIERGVCDIGPLASGLLIYDRPSTGLEGKFSIQYCSAVALSDGVAGLAQFTDARARDPKLQELIGRFEKRIDPDVDPYGDFGSRITLHLRDGRTIARHVTRAQGRPHAEPIPFDEIERKFRECAALCVRAEAVEALVAAMRGLDTVADVRPVAGRIRADLLSATPA